MAKRFRSEHLHKLDSKGRVSIPALFRNVLAENDPNFSENSPPEMVIVYGGAKQNYLECYTMNAIEEVDRVIEGLPRGSMKRRRLQRLFHTFSQPIKLDETGRLVLPQKLREKIGCKSELMFVGCGDTFQIWHPAAWEQLIAEEEEAEGDARELLDEDPWGHDD